MSIKDANTTNSLTLRDVTGGGRGEMGSSPLLTGEWDPSVRDRRWVSVDAPYTPCGQSRLYSTEIVHRVWTATETKVVHGLLAICETCCAQSEQPVGNRHTEEDSTVRHKTSTPATHTAGFRVPTATWNNNTGMCHHGVGQTNRPDLFFCVVTVTVGCVVGWGFISPYPVATPGFPAVAYGSTFCLFVVCPSARCRAWRSTHVSVCADPPRASGVRPVRVSSCGADTVRVSVLGCGAVLAGGCDRLVSPHQFFGGRGVGGGTSWLAAVAL